MNSCYRQMCQMVGKCLFGFCFFKGLMASQRQTLLQKHPSLPHFFYAVLEVWLIEICLLVFSIITGKRKGV